MPSPIAHAAAGYIIFRASREGSKEAHERRVGIVPQLLFVTVGLSLLPDLDVLPGLLFGDLQKYHNNFTHSFLFELGVAILIGGLVKIVRRSGFSRWFGISAMAYELHVLMDMFTHGRGVMAAWPFLTERIEPPTVLFYGLRWSEGFLTPKHFITLATELATALLVVLVAVVLSKLKVFRRSIE